MRLNKIELQEKDYPKALAIWERSVIATHDFLKEKDRIALKRKSQHTSRMLRHICGLMVMMSLDFQGLMKLIWKCYF